jgi:hypothetical protein
MELHPDLAMAAQHGFVLESEPERDLAELVRDAIVLVALQRHASINPAGNASAFQGC